MKIILTLMIALWLQPAFAQKGLSVMTYNIRYDSPNDGPDHWDIRRKMLVDQVNFYAPDVLGVQEAMLHQMEYLQSNLKGYRYVGVGRDDGNDAGEFSAIFYKLDLTLINSGTFWLSETPDRPSKDWDAALPRICTYALLEFHDNRFWIFNTHFDHIGPKARLASSKLILNQMALLNSENLPIVLIGDFNAREKEPPILEISSKYQDSRYSTDQFFGGSDTFNGFQIEPEENSRIDYIFHNDQLISKKTAILSQLIEQHYPSDHFPVISYFVLSQ